MKCPYCGYTNIKGADECESCNENLASLDGVVPHTRMEKVLMSDPIDKLAPRPVLSIPPKTKVSEAVSKMNLAKVGCLLVTDGETIQGILTERDVVHKALAVRTDLDKTTVDAIMTLRVESLSADDSLAYAVNRMAVGGYRHIPILKSGKPTGIISIRDVLKYLARLFP